MDRRKFLIGAGATGVGAVIGNIRGRKTKAAETYQPQGLVIVAESFPQLEKITYLPSPLKNYPEWFTPTPRSSSWRGTRAGSVIGEYGKYLVVLREADMTIDFLMHVNDDDDVLFQMRRYSPEKVLPGHENMVVYEKEIMRPNNHKRDGAVSLWSADAFFTKRRGTDWLNTTVLDSFDEWLITDYYVNASRYYPEWFA